MPALLALTLLLLIALVVAIRQPARPAPIRVWTDEDERRLVRSGRTGPRDRW